jgi:hypothetical protein
MKVARLSALCTGRLYPQEISLVLISVTGRVNPRAILRPEGLREWIVPAKPWGIDPATFRFVAQWSSSTTKRISQTKVTSDTRDNNLLTCSKQTRNFKTCYHRWCFPVFFSSMSLQCAMNEPFVNERHNVYFAVYINNSWAQTASY